MKPRAAARPPMYEVWTSVTHGITPGPRFRLRCDAIRYVLERSSEASFAIKNPDGSWHPWDPDGSRILLRRGSRFG